MAARRALVSQMARKRFSSPRQASARRICDMAKAMVALRARLKPMRATAARSVVTRCAPGFSATEFASCNSRTASDGSALTMRTTSSMLMSSWPSARRTRTATSGKLGSSGVAPASSREIRRVNSASAGLDALVRGINGFGCGHQNNSISPSAGVSSCRRYWRSRATSVSSGVVLSLRTRMRPLCGK